MSRTLAQLRKVGQHAGGGGDPAVVFTDATTTLDTYINDAGRYLFTMRQWKFAERPPTDVDFVADQQYVNLPAGIGQIVSYAGQNNISRPFVLTSMQEIVTYRRSLVLSGAWIYRGAVVFPTQEDTTHVPPVPRLELYPTPSANVTAALTLQSRAGWTKLTNSTDVANIPEQFDMLLDELVAAWVQGKAANDLQQRLAAVEAGPMVARLDAYDGAVQSDYGAPENGALSAAAYIDPYPQAMQPYVVSGP